MFWDGLRIKVTHFPGGERVHSAQLVVAVAGKKKTTVFISQSVERLWPLQLQGRVVMEFENCLFH